VLGQFSILNALDFDPDRRMPPVGPRTYVPSTDSSAFQKLVQPSRKPADTEDPARDGKGDHSFGCPWCGDVHGALLTEAQLLAEVGHVCSSLTRRSLGRLPSTALPVLADPSNAYSRLPSRSAQAVATAEFGVSVPGIVAQPPFSMTDRRFHDETLLNSINFAGASAWCWNFSTQIGASTPTTAV
jgi:hypothetical protein